MLKKINQLTSINKLFLRFGHRAHFAGEIGRRLGLVVFKGYKGKPQRSTDAFNSRTHDSTHSTRFPAHYTLLLSRMYSYE